MICIHQLILILLSTFIVVTKCEDPEVTLPYGKIRGVYTKTIRYRKPFYAFLQVPYAAPPVGKLRFMPPQPVQPWTGILDTKQNNKACHQVGKTASYISEDCLYLNVYTPVAPGTNSNLPVLVYIYGGAFIHGSLWFGTLQPQNPIEKDVIVVLLNYRIGPLGFLSTEDDVIQGNMGLKDQLFVLKWVNENIHLFGGDANKVTLMGQSAGAASVTYHILSPQSKGLFRAAVAESASALCTWAYQRNARQTAYGLAVEIDSNFGTNRSSAELLEFLQSVDVSKIDGTADKYKEFAPVIESLHPDAFITEPMYETIKTGNINKVPLLIGYCSEEQIFHANDMANWKKFIEKNYRNPKNLVNQDMNVQDMATKETIGEQIQNVYTTDSLADEPGKAIQFSSDNTYVRPVIRFAELQSWLTDVFLYQFSYHGIIGNNNATVDGVPGRVAHAEDVRYFWTYFKNYSEFPEEDVRTVDRYLGLITNFIKYLNPTPEHEEIFENILWPKLTSSEMQYLDIDKSLMVKQHPREFSYQKWVDIYNQYATGTLITY
uniref:Carboxylic ester hydrolase n=1 Tax=Diabrotica virgifera virgifera TaxID=50390 RepID=A0A6P7G2M5_DIAVI